MSEPITPTHTLAPLVLLMQDDVSWEESIFPQIIPPFDAYLYGVLKRRTGVERPSGEEKVAYLGRVLETLFSWISEDADQELFLTRFLAQLTTDLNKAAENNARSVECNEVFVVTDADGYLRQIRGDTTLATCANLGLSLDGKTPIGQYDILIRDIPDS